MATEALEAKGEWSGEIEQVTKSGQTLTVEGRWTLVRDDIGAPTSILAINTDATARKQLEQQFLRAQRMESIGTLAGGIAHDLNNVLAPILLSIDFLRRDERDSGRLELLQMIDTSASRGAELVRQVLSFARGLGGDRVEVSPREVIADVARLMRDTFPKDIRIVERADAGLWTLEADATQLHQVLLNLCVNARDAMPAGGTITVSASNRLLDQHYAAMNLEAAEGPYIVLQVEDTGVGIAPGLIEKIFDPFFTTKDVGKGTGLGLATSLAIVKGHGGFLRVSSVPGQGARFDVYFPAVDSAQRPRAAVAAPTPIRGHGETVLVVDDEAAIRQVTKRTLEAFGYRVMLAADGSEAISTYVQHRAAIDLVLTDMMMPVMDGAATVQVLLRLNPLVRIIGTSGREDRAGTDAIRPRLRAFLPKPYTAQSLLATVHDVLATP